MLALAAAAAIAVLFIALPASLARPFLPTGLSVANASGTIWHGLFEGITYEGRDLGAIEWRLQAAALLQGHITGPIHWVKGSSVLDTTLDAQRSGIELNNLAASGAIADLGDLAGPGWLGTFAVSLARVAIVNHGIESVQGVIRAEHLTSPRVGGADIGGYELQLDGVSHADGSVAGTVTDLGGAMEVHALLSLVPAQRMGTLTGTVKERAQVPPAVQTQLNNLAQLQGRDPQGRIPLSLEFAL
jgi:Type II secretion system (T2SS), protein N